MLQMASSQPCHRSTLSLLMQVFLYIHQYAHISLQGLMLFNECKGYSSDWTWNLGGKLWEQYSLLRHQESHWNSQGSSFSDWLGWIWLMIDSKKCRETVLWKKWRSFQDAPGSRGWEWVSQVKRPRATVRSSCIFMRDLVKLWAEASLLRALHDCYGVEFG